jgi:hypothetical protein
LDPFGGLVLLVWGTYPSNQYFKKYGAIMQSTEESVVEYIKKLGISYNLPENWLQDRPHLFSAAKVPVTTTQLSQINAIINVIESIIKLPAYQQKVLSWAPETAQFDPGVPGVFFGYDFHLTPHGPKLIEINSNAGSAAISALLSMAQTTQPSEAWMQQFAHIFLNEWHLKHPNQKLSTVAIVDEKPQQQYLLPDFHLFRVALERHGINTAIVDPQDLVFKKQKLYCGETTVDLVYNRLTDFSLTAPTHRALKDAYLADKVVVTPHPRAHALYADKRNLKVLTDLELLQSWGLTEDQLSLLQKSIPRVYIVNEKQADELWEMRRHLFFKPVASFGGKGTYRGAKISRKVFNEILKSEYVAQMLMPPSEQQIEVNGESQTFKTDIRSYVYQANPIGMIARVYQGQVTNMRTPGGGFAVVELQA